MPEPLSFSGRAFKLLYSGLAAPVIMGAYKTWSLHDHKALEFFKEREGMLEELAGALEGSADGVPTVLFHAASVGELLQVMPVMRQMAEKGEPVFSILSYTSPSVTRNRPKRIAANVITPSPLDRPRQVSRFLDITGPDLIVFSTYDVWPGMVYGALERGIPMALVNGSLPPNSGRLKFPARAFMKSVYGPLGRVGAVTEADAGRFESLGVSPSRIRVTGDCRFDQTMARCEAVRDDDPDISMVPRFGFTLVGGSTWPEDLRLLLPPLCALMKNRPELGAILAPHEMDESEMGKMERTLEGAGLKTVRYSALKKGNPACESRVVVVDALGVLYKLYKKGDLAYVGGGFGKGVHNVMEPAGMGLPVFFGPNNKNSAEAQIMMGEGAARPARGAGEVESILREYVESPERAKKDGGLALSIMKRNEGATAGTVEMVRELLCRRRPGI